MSRRDRQRGGPEETPPDPASHPPPPHGSYGLPGPRWARRGLLRATKEGAKSQTQLRWVSQAQGGTPSRELSPGGDVLEHGFF